MSNFEMNSFTTKNGKSLKITFFKHASLLLDYAGQKIFIDPVSDYADYINSPKISNWKPYPPIIRLPAGINFIPKDVTTDIF